MSDPLRSAVPVSASGGFADRPKEPPRRRTAELPPPAKPRPHDEVVLAAMTGRARRLLRECVLTRTRQRLGLGDGDVVHVFAEDFDAESVDDFLGRLLSAQNQLGALRARALGPAPLRQALDGALRDGATEAAEMLAADVATGGAAVAVVAEVLEAYARRLAALVGLRAT
ncbi:MAG: hypothetical protein FJ301_00760 [Planctomycetes bacterium]|nr:hypothetical protein [Planctomycetota bacterium]